MKRYLVLWCSFLGMLWLQGCTGDGGLGSTNNSDTPDADAPSNCIDLDGDGAKGFDAVNCVTGLDHCDDDANNWTDEGCSSCVDRDGDGYGEGCDKGPDCDDTNDQVFDQCSGLIWAQKAGGVSKEYAAKITELSDGSIALVGVFEGSIVFGEGESNETVLQCAEGSDLFVARYSRSGAFLWGVRAGGSGVDVGRAMTSLPDNGILVAGRFGGSSVFGQGEPNETVLQSNGSSDIFVAKFDSNGVLIWARAMGSTFGDSAEAVALLSDGSAVVTGSFGGTMAVELKSGDQTILTSRGKEDIFVARYDAAGDVIWAKSAGGVGEDSGASIAVLNDDSVVVTGQFKQDAVFGQDDGNPVTLSGQGGMNMYVARYSSEGRLIWARQSAGCGETSAEAIASSDDTILVTGSFSGNVSFDANQMQSVDKMDIFLIKLDVEGNVIWARQAGGPGSDLAHGLSMMADGSAVVAGSFFDSVVLGMGEPNEKELVSAGGEDIYVARFSADGNLIWAGRAGGVYHDSGKGIAALKGGSVVITGYFASEASFSLANTYDSLLQSTGDWDVFLARVYP